MQRAFSMLSQLENDPFFRGGGSSAKRWMFRRSTSFSLPWC
jgi:hypothetical protein